MSSSSIISRLPLLLFGPAVVLLLLAYWTNNLEQEQCGKYWRNFNVTAFELYLKNQLFGQPLVISSISKSLSNHVLKAIPRKALVMSFHGWTGSGKNHASKLIADFLFENGLKSNFVHLYIATRDFPHSSDIKKYRARLQQEISEYTTACGHSLFIFDEIDKLEPGIIDAVKPFIDFYQDINGVDYRKNIFIFLSNSGGSKITELTLNFWLDGKDREDLNINDFEPVLHQGAYFKKSGHQFSEIIERGLVDVFVPFLPLERSHIKQCIATELKTRNLEVNAKLINYIAEQLVYYPHEFELFSSSGCKQVSTKVDIFAS